MIPPGRIVFAGGAYAGYHPAGSGVQMQQLGRELRRRGWDVYYTDTTHPAPPGELLRHDGWPILRIHPIDQFSWRTVEQNARLLAELEPHWIFLRGSNALVAAVFQAARRSGARVVWSCGSDMVARLNPLSGLQRQATFASPGYWRALWAAWFWGPIEHRCRAQAQVRLVQHEGQRQLLAQTGLDSVVVYNGWPVPPPPRAKAPRLTVYWISHVKLVKRVDRLYRIAQLCRDAPIDFHLVGDIPGEEARRECERLAGELPSFHWEGGWPVEQVDAALGSGHVLLNTSEFEGFPNTFLQAWSRGGMVVTCGVDPNGILADGVLGRRTESVEQAAALLRDWACDPEGVARMGREAYARMAATYAIERIADRLLAAMETGVQ